MELRLIPRRTTVFILTLVLLILCFSGNTEGQSRPKLRRPSPPQVQPNHKPKGPATKETFNPAIHKPSSSHEASRKPAKRAQGEFKLENDNAKPNAPNIAQTPGAEQGPSLKREASLNPEQNDETSQKDRTSSNSRANQEQESHIVGSDKSQTSASPEKSKVESPTKDHNTATDDTDKPRRSPNILIIIADDLGIGDVGCFGNDTIRTPNLDRLAEDGLKLTHHLTTAAVCTPSRSSLMTGRYPARMGMIGTDLTPVHIFTSCSGGLPPNEITIAQLAKERGYSTALLGKWHLGLNCNSTSDFCHHPLKFGFDYFFGLPLTNMNDFGKQGGMVINRRRPVAQPVIFSTSVGGILLAVFLWRSNIIRTRTLVLLSILFMLPSLGFMGVFYTVKRFSGLVMRNYDLVEQPIDLEGFTHRMLREATDFLQARHGDQRPFLLVFSSLQVHTALHASPPFVGRSKHGAYGDEVEEMDWSVGELLAALEGHGFADDTFVYFTSDNGPHLEEKGIHGETEGGYNGIYRGGKFQGGMDGGIRVSTIARYPGVIPKGSVSVLPTSQMDIFPTVASMLGVPLPQNVIIDGVNILPHMSRKSSEPPHDFLVHWCGQVVHAARLVQGRDVYKAHFITPNWIPGTEFCDNLLCECEHRVTHHDPPLLYNIATDPEERKGLDANLPEHQRILATIKERLSQHYYSLAPVESQFSWQNSFPRYWNQLCCNFPYCSCTDPDKRKIRDTRKQVA